MSPSPVHRGLGPGTSLDLSEDSMLTPLQLTITGSGRGADAGLYREIDSLRGLAIGQCERLDRLTREVAALKGSDHTSLSATSVVSEVAAELTNSSAVLKMVEQRLAERLQDLPNRDILAALENKVEARLAHIEAEVASSRATAEAATEDNKSAASAALHALEERLTEILHELGVIYEDGHSAVISRLAAQQEIVDDHQANIQELGCLLGFEKVGCRAVGCVPKSPGCIEGGSDGTSFRTEPSTEAASAALSITTIEARRSAFESLEVRLTQMLTELGQEHQRAITHLLEELESLHERQASVQCQYEEQGIALCVLRTNFQALARTQAEGSLEQQLAISKQQAASSKQQEATGSLEYTIGKRPAEENSFASKPEVEVPPRCPICEQLAGELETEAKKRREADGKLEARLHAEAARRHSVDERLSGELQAESRARAEAIAVLLGRLSDLTRLKGGCCSRRVAEVILQETPKAEGARDAMVVEATAATNIAAEATGAASGAPSVGARDELAEVTQAALAETVAAPACTNDTTDETVAAATSSLTQLHVELSGVATEAVANGLAGRQGESFKVAMTEALAQTLNNRQELPSEESCLEGPPCRPPRVATAAEATESLSAMRSSFAGAAIVKATAVAAERLAAIRADLVQLSEEGTTTN